MSDLVPYVSGRALASGREQGMRLGGTGQRQGEGDEAGKDRAAAGSMQRMRLGGTGQGGGLSLNMLVPMQRLTKYSLLLKAILKKTTLEEHRQGLHEMITHVENFVSNVNSALRQKHEQERLQDISKRIEAYEAVEARDDELERVVKKLL
ncbi:Pleckstrin y domain-containing family G member 5 [Chionoecetes opilio]|uniref:Pleckstrin y domain-containing family G member 5 n=1 Tax=Chionoecetes opilio TaxID=41210 RepID=A0A8J5CR40_CHIOP|nr:Pleckstrin y domain-containing family G member 5 [Chionoecetes opilio]